MSKAFPAPQRRFLVVDDNPLFADQVAEIAGAQGFQVDVTTTADDFKSAFLAAEPSVIGVDLVMPDADGLELLAWLCCQGSTVPALVFSGKEAVYLKAAKVLVEARGNFSIETFGKPLDDTALAASLRRLCPVTVEAEVGCLANTAGGD